MIKYVSFIYLFPFKYIINLCQVCIKILIWKSLENCRLLLSFFFFFPFNFQTDFSFYLDHNIQKVSFAEEVSATVSSLEITNLWHLHLGHVVWTMHVTNLMFLSQEKHTYTRSYLVYVVSSWNFYWYCSSWSGTKKVLCLKIDIFWFTL